MKEDIGVELIDATTGTRLASKSTRRMPHEVAFDDASRLAYVCITYQDGSYNNLAKPSHYIEVISVDDMFDADLIDIQPHFAPHGIALSYDRSALYVTCESNGGEVVVVDLDSKQVANKVGVDAHGPHWMAVLPDQSKTYTANQEYPFVSVVDLRALRLIRTIPAPKGTESIVATPDSLRVFVSSQRSPDLYVIDTETDRIEEVITLPEPPGALAVTPDGSTLLVTTFNFTHWEEKPIINSGYLQVVNARTLEPGARIEVGRFPINVISSPDGATAFVSNFQDNTISAVDLETMASTTWPVGGGPHGIAYVAMST